MNSEVLLNPPKRKLGFLSIIDAILPVAIYYAFSFGVVLVFQMIIGVYLGATRPELANDMEAFKEVYMDLYIHNAIVVTLVADALVIPCMIFYMWLDKKSIIKRGYEIEHKKCNPLLYGIIIPFAAALLFAGNYTSSIINSLLPDKAIDSYDSAAQVLYSGNPVIMVIAVAIVGPIMEELVFRGLVYNKIKNLSNITIGAICSAVIFGAIHGNWVQGIYAAILGLGCVFVYEKYKTIIAPMLVHITANSISITMTLLLSKDEAAKGADKIDISLIPVIALLTIIAYAIAAVFAVAIIYAVKAEKTYTKVQPVVSEESMELNTDYTVDEEGVL